MEADPGYHTRDPFPEVSVNLDQLISPEQFILIAIFLLVGFPVHEFAHAYVAYRQGDATAKMFGRLTLNPIVHFDPIGGLFLIVSVLVPLFILNKVLGKDLTSSL